MVNITKLLYPWRRGWQEVPFPVSPPAYNPAHEPAPLEDRLQRGMAAQRILGDPTLAEAFEQLRRDNYQLWLHSNPDDGVTRELLYREARALNSVAAKLRGYIGDAKLRAAVEAQTEAEDTAA